MNDALHNWDRIIVHADMDSFYASVEQLDNPGLRGRPVLVGSSSGRGVVLTASYEARPFGVGSAMPMVQARRLCPDALVVPPRFKRYQELSTVIMAVFSDFSPIVEPLSLDEAFLEMTGSEGLFGEPKNMGRQLKEAVKSATQGLTVSVGVSGTKYVAKVASGFAKPDGLTVVAPTAARRWLAPLPVSKLWGAGKKNQTRLAEIGLKTIGDVANTKPSFLVEQLGNVGSHFYSLSHAEDMREVESQHTAKSIGSEHTLDRDTRNPREIKNYLRRSTDTIARRLRNKGLIAAGIRIKLKTSEFQLLTRQEHFDKPTDVADVLYKKVNVLLSAFPHSGPFRLVGVTAFDLRATKDPLQLSLLNCDGRERRLESTLDKIVERFGEDAVQRAGDPKTTLGADLAANMDFLDKKGIGEP
ncbi:MAG: DNA polymerase IV [Pseudomonadota bacterium]|nr:DNA polymerase IV [Pseudomonadota bacterium]